MSNPILPAELLDHIVNHLDTIRALRNCCLVSKSWIPRTRKHLFTKINFDVEQKLHSWKQTFPDPSTSPACYAKTLSIDCLRAVTAADAEVGGWIRSFSRVVHLEMDSNSEAVIESMISFVPFHGFSPFIKSLRIDSALLPSSRVFNLILSFPLLEDLSLTAYGASTGDADSPDGLPTISHLSAPPMFTGFLRLFMSRGMTVITHRLLSLPAGIHFREVTSTWFDDEDPLLTMAVVEKCSRTIETLDITCYLFRSAAIDLSKATKLKNVIFRLKSMDVGWITTAFRTTVPELPELWHISIRVPYDLATFNFKRTHLVVYGEWLELDRLLVQFLESRSICSKVVCTALMGGEQDMRDFVEYMLPELTRRGMSDLVELGASNELRIGKPDGRFQPVWAEFGHHN